MSRPETTPPPSALYTTRPFSTNVGAYRFVVEMARLGLADIKPSSFSAPEVPALMLEFHIGYHLKPKIPGRTAMFDRQLAKVHFAVCKLDEKDDRDLYYLLWLYLEKGEPEWQLQPKEKWRSALLPPGDGTDPVADALKDCFAEASKLVDYSKPVTYNSFLGEAVTDPAEWEGATLRMDLYAPERMASRVRVLRVPQEGLMSIRNEVHPL